MIKTFPIPVSFLTDPRYFVFGRRVQKLLREPFDLDVLQKRVMRKDRNGNKGVAAYYIDTRGLDERLDFVVGPRNWTCDIHGQDMGDRVTMIASLSIGGAYKSGESEELKSATKWEEVYDDVQVTETFSKNDDTGVTTKTEVKDVRRPVTDQYGKPKKANLGNTESKELAVLRCGPNALKRAGVHFGIAAYLYRMKENERWEDLTAYGRRFKEPDIKLADLPAWAQPTPGWALVIEELAYLFGVKLPQRSEWDPQSVAMECLMNNLDKFWGVETLKDGMNRQDYFELAGCIARISDYADSIGACCINGDWGEGRDLGWIKAKVESCAEADK